VVTATPACGRALRFAFVFDYFDRLPRSKFFALETPRAIESSCRRWDSEQRLLENGEEYNKG
jgi:hypothetical protein